MFTGIVQEIGKIATIEKKGMGVGISFRTKESFIRNLALGDSVAVNGACLTVTQKTKTQFSAFLLTETLSKTTFQNATEGDSVNLEPSLSVGDKLGGHWVTGHVDEMAKIESLDHKNPSAILRIRYSSKFQKNLVPKGSIAIDGVSLTLVDITPRTFSCHIIPHTLHHTILGTKTKGDTVNLEYDILGKYALNKA